MKITISTHEGTAYYSEFSCVMDDDSKLDSVVDNLEHLLRCFFSETLVLYVSDNNSSKF